MRHSRRLVAPINTIKHYVHRANTGTASAVVVAIVVVDAVSGAAANSFDVKEGSIVKAIHFDMWCLAQGASGTFTQLNLIIEKVPSNVASVTAAQIVNLGAYTNKKNILYSFQGVIGAEVDGQASLPMVPGWLLIPKGKQRMGLGDRVVLSFSPIGQTANTCGLMTYKEWT